MNKGQNLTRYDGVSYLRVFAMLLVLLYHCLCMFTNRWSFVGVEKNDACEMICSILNYIHLPLFILISGFLYGMGISKGKYMNRTSFLKKKAIRLGVPYLFWGGIMLLLQPDFYKFSFFIRGFAHLWFLLCLLEQFIFFSLFRNILIPKKSRSKIFVLIASYAISCIVFCDKPMANRLSIFCIDKFIYYFPVFYWGVILSDLLKEIKVKRHWAICGMLLSATYLMLSIVSGRILGGIIDFFMFDRLAGYIFVVCLFILSYQVCKCSFICNWLDKNSMGIYIIHHILIMYLLQYSWFLQMMESHLIMGVIVLFGGILLISLLLSETILRTRCRFLLG